MTWLISFNTWLKLLVYLALPSTRFKKHGQGGMSCFSGVTYFPWCRKGQNEGTIINHLRMVHYKLGLICEKCFCFPSITSEAIQCHSQKNCEPSAEGGPNESSLLVYPLAQSMLDQLSHDGNLDGESKGGSDICWATLSGIPPAPIVWTQKEHEMEELPSTNLMHTYHLSLPTPRLDCCCHPWFQGCLLHLPKMLNFTNIRHIRG